jgi:hypothetical protein
MSNPQNGMSVPATLRLRGNYLVLLVNGAEASAYARPGESLVASAQNSPEAAALARAISGKIYEASSQAGGRGAFVGGRIKLALCSNGGIAFDASNLASAPGGFNNPGVDMGGSVSRRGQWSIVLLGGAPVVRAEWEGTGSTYSLTGYFRIRPAANGRSANVDGIELPVSGGC